MYIFRMLVNEVKPWDDRSTHYTGDDAIGKSRSDQGQPDHHWNPKPPIILATPESN